MDNSSSIINQTCGQIDPVEEAWLIAARERVTLTKLPGSLGRLEEIANRLAAIQQTVTPRVTGKQRATCKSFARCAGELRCEEIGWNL